MPYVPPHLRAKQAQSESAPPQAPLPKPSSEGAPPQAPSAPVSLLPALPKTVVAPVPPPADTVAPARAPSPSNYKPVAFKVAAPVVVKEEKRKETFNSFTEWVKDPPKSMFLSPLASITKYKALSQDLLLLSGDGEYTILMHSRTRALLFFFSLYHWRHSQTPPPTHASS